MKKYLLFASVFGLSSALFAQEPILRQPTLKPIMTTGKTHFPSRLVTTNQSSSRSTGVTSITISTIGNVYGVTNAACNQIDVDSATKTVVVIHRKDPHLPSTAYTPTNNTGMYMYDVSKNGGASFDSTNLNVGPVNPSNNALIPGKNGRFPQAVLYNPTGVNNADSVYMVYTGSWHDGSNNANWMGECRGRAQMTNATTSFREKFDTLNNGSVLIGTGFTSTPQGKFFNANINCRKNGTNGVTIQSLNLQKGVWNTTTNNVDYTSTNFPLTLDWSLTTSNDTASIMGNPVIAFDPSGMIGYIVFNADMTVDGQVINKLTTMKTTDGGTTWSVPAQLMIDSLPNITLNFPLPVDANSNPILGEDTVFRSIVSDLDATVDMYGNLHVGVVLQLEAPNGSYFPFAGIASMDVVLSNTPITGVCTYQNWSSIFLNQLNSTRGEYTQNQGSADPAMGDYNRIQASRTKDGKKVFFFWNDTDSSVVAAHDRNAPETRNESPDLFGAGIDASTHKMTHIKNFTKGDANFGGNTASSTTGSAIGGTYFHITSPNALEMNNKFNIPHVFTQPDYQAGTGNTKSGIKPAQLFYINDINFTQAEFNQSLEFTLNLSGPDTFCVLVGDSYTDTWHAAGFNPCAPGLVTVTNDSVSTATAGYKVETLTGTDPLGGTSTTTRIINVVAPTKAKIWYAKKNGLVWDFRDTSTVLGTSRVWHFGDGQVSSSKYVTHTYNKAQVGPKMVILTEVNCASSSNDTIYITVDGINDPTISAEVNVYPVPTSSYLNLEVSEAVAEDATYTIHNLLGEVVTAKKAIKSTLTSIDVRNLVSGVYFVRIDSKNGSAVKNVIINRN